MKDEDKDRTLDARSGGPPSPDPLDSQATWIGPSPKETPEEQLPHWIAGYRILRKIGQGGMGIVFEAEQQDPRRSVALKLIRSRGYVDEHTVRLFQREAQSLARLKHPGIASIYEAGRTDDGRRFFAMELVAGADLDRHLAENPIGAHAVRERIRARLDLFLEICSAINYAHQRGVIHRDLKPSNIKVLEADEVSSRSVTRHRTSRIKILDFGLARITDPEAQRATVLTEVGSIQGSLPYMSPEQARGSTDEIDLRSDVYSLGMILFEMLTDRRPYDVEGLPIHEAVRAILEEPPRRPSAIISLLRGDLETIVLKALEKDPARRYQSVLALAEDIERYLSDQPILARHPSTAYQLRKLVARHKTLFVFLGAGLILLVAFGITMSIMFGIQRRERMRADAERDKAVLEAAKAEQINTFLQEMLSSIDPEKALGREITVREVLDEAAGRVGITLTNQPEVEAAVRSTIGLTYVALGHYDVAEPHLREALSIREEALGQDDLEVATSLNELATLNWRKGNYQAADSLWRRALSIQRNKLGAANSEVAMSLSNLGVLLKDQGKFAEAESLHRTALDILRGIYGREHTEIALSLANLAAALQAQGKLPEAESVCREALGMRRTLLGTRHPEVGSSLNNLASILQAEGKYEEAEPLMRESLEMERSVLGEDHPTVAMALANLGNLLYLEGKQTEAQLLCRQALQLQRKLLGSEHPVIASTLSNLASSLQAEGRIQEAEPLYRQVLAMRRKLLGEEHPAVATSINNLALVLQDQGRLAEAEQTFREALAMRRRLLAPQHPHVANSLLGVAAILMDKGDAAGAEPLLRECLTIRRRAQTLDPLSIATAESYLGGCLAMQRRFDEAESLLTASVPLILSTPRAPLKRKREALERTIRMYEDWGKPERCGTYRAELAQLENTHRRTDE